MNKLEAINLNKSYKNREVVKSVSLHVNQGQIVGLLGPNGAGKTTSFYMAVGLVPCDKGQVILNGIDITSMTIDKRARMGLSYLPQESSIFRKLSVKDNLLAILELTNPGASKHMLNDELNHLLQEFHLDHLKNSDGISLSGGERRRVEIARAIATKPKFILLDEPFAGIDPISIIDIQRIISQLSKKNIGVLITDHNVRETLTICHYAYIVGEGTIIAKGKPDEILKNKEVRKVYLGDDFDL